MTELHNALSLDVKNLFTQSKRWRIQRTRSFDSKTVVLRPRPSNSGSPLTSLESPSSSSSSSSSYQMKLSAMRKAARDVNNENDKHGTILTFKNIPMCLIFFFKVVNTAAGWFWKKKKKENRNKHWCRFWLICCNDVENTAGRRAINSLRWPERYRQGRVHMFWTECRILCCFWDWKIQYWHWRPFLRLK